MTKSVDYLLKELKDSQKEIDIIRSGLKTTVVDSFLEEQHFAVKDVLERLDIPASTYFAKKKKHQALDSHSTEKFIRLMSVTMLAMEIIGKETGREWIEHKVPSLGNQVPLNLLDTEAGHKLVIQTLMRIKYGMYS